jgi:regulator of replication initiation timing
MNNFYNLEYLNERLAATCKERDELRQMLNAAIMAQETLQKELDRANNLLTMARAERDVVTKRMIELEITSGGK